MPAELFEMELREKGRAEGRKQGMGSALISNIKCLTSTLHFTVEQAMNALCIPMEDRARLSAQL